MRGSYFFVEPGSKSFKVATNFTNYLELGIQSSAPDYYLEAKVADDDFVINAVLWEPTLTAPLRIVDSFPDGPEWTRKMLPNGWHIVNKTGQLMFGLEVQGSVCHIKGEVRSRDGTLVAQDSNDDYLIYKGPAILGRSGSARGLVIA
jgi:hypothetical protein